MSSLNLAQLVKSTANSSVSILKSKINKISLLVFTILATISNTITMYAAGADEFKLGTERFKFTEIDTLVSMGARTLQYFAGGIAVVFLIINGIKIMTSSDSQRAMEEAKSGIWKIMLGCGVVFLAATLVGIFFTAVNK
jgi:Type IV secretion system pilin